MLTVLTEIPIRMSKKGEKTKLNELSRSCSLGAVYSDALKTDDICPIFFLGIFFSRSARRRDFKTAFRWFNLWIGGCFCCGQFIFIVFHSLKISKTYSHYCWIDTHNRICTAIYRRSNSACVSNSIFNVCGFCRSRGATLSNNSIRNVCKRKVHNNNWIAWYRNRHKKCGVICPLISLLLHY